MKFSPTAAAILFFFLICQDITAGTVHRWTDENGVVHITNRPSLKAVKGRKIIRYQEKTTEEKLKYQNLQKKELESNYLHSQLDELPQKLEKIDEELRAFQETIAEKENRLTELKKKYRTYSTNC